MVQEETEWANATANYMTNSAVRSESDEEDDSSSSAEDHHQKRTRTKRDIDVDPIHKEPIIYLGVTVFDLHRAVSESLDRLVPI